MIYHSTYRYAPTSTGAELDAIEHPGELSTHTRAGYRKRIKRGLRRRDRHTARLDIHRYNFDAK